MSSFMYRLQTRRLGIFAASVLFAFALGGCSRHEKPNFIYMPDMHYSPAYKAQEPGAVRKPPAGTLPVSGYAPYAYTDNAVAGRELKNPLPRSKEVLMRGQKVFNTYCIVCHGPRGEGDGHIVPKFPRPPSLQSEKVRAWADGNIFDVITRGQNLMSSYATAVPVKDRWAVIHYVRVLQRANKPTAEDLKALEASK